MKATGGLIVAK